MDIREQAVKNLTESFIERGVCPETARAWAEAETPDVIFENCTFWWGSIVWTTNGT